MRIMTVGGVRIVVNPLLPLLILLCALTGSLVRLALAFLSLAVHEAAHTALSRALGYAVSEIELLPFGFVARLNERPRGLWDELMIAAAGPIASLVMAVTLSQFAGALRGAGILYELAGINTGIALINLLPAVPLDGGRMAKALLGRVLAPRAAAVTAAIISFVVSLAAIFTGTFILIRGGSNITLAVFGVFLAAGAAGEYRRREGAGLTATIDRRESIGRGGTLAARQIVVGRDACCRDVLKHFRSSRFTLLLVVDADMRPIAQLSEADVVDRISKFGPEARICAEDLTR